MSCLLLVSANFIGEMSIMGSPLLSANLSRSLKKAASNKDISYPVTKQLLMGLASLKIIKLTFRTGVPQFNSWWQQTLFHVIKNLN